MGVVGVAMAMFAWYKLICSYLLLFRSLCLASKTATYVFIFAANLCWLDSHCVVAPLSMKWQKKHS